MIIKATIWWRTREKKLRQCTINVSENEPNEIIREAVEQGKFTRLTYVWKIKCGKYLYQWYGLADYAFITSHPFRDLFE